MINNIINATSIHRGGGLTYLLLIHKYIDKKNKLIFLDSRSRKYIKDFKNIKIIFLKKGPFRNIKILFYRIKYIFKFNKLNSKGENKKKFTELSLNGLPPLFRVGNKFTKVYIFCQNRLVFEKNNSKLFGIFNFKIYLYLLIHKILFNLFKRPNDIIIVQTQSMRKLLLDLKIKNKILLQEKIWGNINKENYLKILDLGKKDFQYNPKLAYIKNLYKSNILYFYPAYFLPHKNHFKLLKAFEEFEKNDKNPHKLLLTINKIDYHKLVKKNNQNVILLNDLSYKEMFIIYRYIDYLIFPSLIESYGLPLLEAKFSNVDIIASDLPFVYDICKPFLTFNPNEIEDIFEKVKYSLELNKRFE
ncbi:glycosyltransferase [bacterium]|nr:glycosyltransferase [bacterium]